MKKSTKKIGAIVLGVLAVLSAQPVLADVFTWSGAGGLDLFWDNGDNWTPAGPPGDADDARFDDGGTTNFLSADFPNIIVMTNQTIHSLTFGQTNGIHNLVVAPGSTLTVSSTSAGNVVFAGTGTDLGATQQEQSLIGGNGASLLVDATNASFNVRQGSTSSGSHRSTLDLSPLDNFTAHVNRFLVAGDGSSASDRNRPAGTLYLAKTNVIVAYGTGSPINGGSAPAIDMADGSSNGGNAVMQLGQTNAIFADSFGVGRQKSTATFSFNPYYAATSPTLFMRGATSERMRNWVIGDNSSQSTSGSKCTGTVDLSNGILDVMVETNIVGIGQRSSGGGSATGNLTMTAGLLDVNTMEVGYQNANNAGSVVTGNVTINGGTLRVNDLLEMAHFSGSGSVPVANLNVNYGNVVINGSLINGGGTSAITMYTSTFSVTNILGNVGSVAAPIGTMTLGDTMISIAVAGSPKIVVNNLITGGTSNYLNVTFIPVITEYPAQFPVISYTAPIQGADFNFALGSLPTKAVPYEGYLSNNTANGTVDLVVTAGPEPPGPLTWSGEFGADWAPGMSNWLSDASLVAFNTGDPVLFDDTATGTTTVNIAETVLPANLIVSNDTLPYVLTGPGGISGAGGLIKDGDGTLTIDNSGVNDFVGNIEIYGGTLQVGSGGATGSLPAANISNDGSLVYNHSDDVSVAGAITGTGSVSQDGDGALYLTGANTYSGPTMVNSGTLVVNGVLAGGGMLTNAPDTVIAGNGTNSGPVVAAGRIAPGDPEDAGTFTADGGLTLAPGALVETDLNSTDNSLGSGINDLLQVTGNLVVNSNKLVANFQGLPLLGVQYYVITYSGALNGHFDPVAGGTHYTATVDDTSVPGYVYVTFDGTGTDLKWSSRTSGAWDVGGSSNWLNMAESAQDYFYAGDNVLFDDSVADVVTNLTLDAPVFPTSVTNMSSMHDFDIEGPGRISGAASIYKSGTSTMTLGTANDFSGTVEVAGGTLKVGAGTSLGTTAGGTTIDAGGTLDVNGQDLGSEPVTVSGAGVDGKGAVVNSGGQQIHALKAVTLTGDTVFGGEGRWDIRGGGASISTLGQPFKITKVGTNQIALVAVDPIDGALGDIDIREGVFAIQTTTTQLGDPNGTITIHSNATLNVYRLSTALNKKVRMMEGGIIYSENDPSTISGPVTLDGDGIINVNSGGSNPMLTLDNALDGAAGFTKIGSAPLILNAASTYAGQTIVSNGYCHVMGSIQGSGVTVYGGSLSGVGSIAAPVDVEDGGTLAPAGNGTNGSLTINGDLTLAGTVALDVDRTGGAYTSDTIPGVRQLTFGGTLQLNMTGETPQLGDVVTLFSFTGASGSFANITPVPGPGLGWDQSRLAIDGTLKVVVPTTPAHIDVVSVSGNTLNISGSGGNAGYQFQILTTMNINLPLSEWTPMATNSFDGSGNFDYSGTIDTTAPQRFFLLQQ